MLYIIKRKTKFSKEHKRFLIYKKIFKGCNYYDIYLSCGHKRNWIHQSILNYLTNKNYYYCDQGCSNI